MNFPCYRGVECLLSSVRLAVWLPWKLCWSWWHVQDFDFFNTTENFHTQQMSFFFSVSQKQGKIIQPGECIKIEWLSRGIGKCEKTWWSALQTIILISILENFNEYKWVVLWKSIFNSITVWDKRLRIYSSPCSSSILPFLDWISQFFPSYFWSSSMQSRFHFSYFIFISNVVYCLHLPFIFKTENKKNVTAFLRKADFSSNSFVTGIMQTFIVFLLKRTAAA